ncbi:MAG: pseudouridine synthase [Termitinemataceae bacterium]|nr:MAG: pseudouridine synthase [Termitinemataceae bacterium]
MFHVKQEPLYAARHPFIHTEAKDYLVAYKPPKMHSVPIAKTDTGTLLHWCAAYFPEILSIAGKKPIEGSILHRLDYETSGLVLFARTQEAMNNLLQQQEDGLFIKTYFAKCEKVSGIALGFPPLLKEYINLVDSTDYPKKISSFFRAFGKGRKEVRPVLCDHTSKKAVATDLGNPYITTILDCKLNNDDSLNFRLRLNRGFRHQIRCHLAWLGYPILNDPLYNKKSCNENNFMQLFATDLFFLDPQNGKPTHEHLTFVSRETFY